MVEGGFDDEVVLAQRQKGLQDSAPYHPYIRRVEGDDGVGRIDAQQRPLFFVGAGCVFLNRQSLGPQPEDGPCERHQYERELFHSSVWIMSRVLLLSLPWNTIFVSWMSIWMLIGAFALSWLTKVLKCSCTSTM